MSAKVAKKISKETTAQVAPAPVATPVTPAPAPAVDTTPVEDKKARRKKTTAETTTPAPAVTAVAPVADAVSEEETTEDADGKRRTPPTRDSVEAEFNALSESLDQEIARLRESPSKSKGVKFLRVLGKRLKNLRIHTLRVMKQKKPSQKMRTTANSGFLKPVRISKELAKFTGWNEEELRSRVDVTKYICNYIKEHNLQNPTDRRQIKIDEDNKLKKLLNYDAKKEKTPLTYYSLQSHLKSHFTPVEAPATTSK